MVFGHSSCTVCRWAPRGQLCAQRGPHLKHTCNLQLVQDVGARLSSGAGYKEHTLGVWQLYWIPVVFCRWSGALDVAWVLPVREYLALLTAVATGTKSILCLAQSIWGILAGCCQRKVTDCLSFNPEAWQGQNLLVLTWGSGLLSGVYLMPDSLCFMFFRSIPILCFHKMGLKLYT